MQDDGTLILKSSTKKKKKTGLIWDNVQKMIYVYVQIYINRMSIGEIIKDILLSFYCRARI